MKEVKMYNTLTAFLGLAFLLAGMSLQAQSIRSVMLPQSTPDSTHLLFLQTGPILDRAELYQEAPSLYVDPVIKQAFFCELEDQGARRAKIPMKFRLGTVEYVDKKEGKGTGRTTIRPDRTDHLPR